MQENKIRQNKTSQTKKPTKGIEERNEDLSLITRAQFKNLRLEILACSSSSRETEVTRSLGQADWTVLIGEFWASERPCLKKTWWMATEA